MNYLENAVKNSYTYLTAHPKDEEALDNVRYYMEQKGFKQEWLVDLWQKDYEVSDNNVQATPSTT